MILRSSSCDLINNSSNILLNLLLAASKKLCEGGFGSTKCTFLWMKNGQECRIIYDKCCIQVLQILSCVTAWTKMSLPSETRLNFLAGLLTQAMHPSPRMQQSQQSNNTLYMKTYPSVYSACKKPR